MDKRKLNRIKNRERRAIKILHKLLKLEVESLINNQEFMTILDNEIEQLKTKEDKERYINKLIKLMSDS